MKVPTLEQYGSNLNLRLGFNGYWLEQVTDDSINDVTFPHSKERQRNLAVEEQHDRQTR